jgi:hypothetical protein
LKASILGLQRSFNSFSEKTTERMCNSNSKEKQIVESCKVQNNCKSEKENVIVSILKTTRNKVQANKEAMLSCINEASLIIKLC